MNPDDDDPYGEKDGILPEDYRYTAELLRKYSQDADDMRFVAGSLFGAVCVNNLNIILAALDAAGRDNE